MQWILLILSVIIIIQNIMLYRIWKFLKAGDNEAVQLQKELMNAQEEKLKLLTEQTAKNLMDIKQATDVLNLQTEERMRSFSQENANKLLAIQTVLQQNLQMIQNEQSQQLEEVRQIVDEKLQKILQERMQLLFSSIKELTASQSEKLDVLIAHTLQNLNDVKQASEISNRQNEERMRSFSQEHADKLTVIQTTVQQNLQRIQEEQSRELEKMRQIVDEKMQKVLNERMQQAFSSVNERLEQVHKGLGEMQTLAGNVGDLKKMLSNVKVRGEIGEIQLEAILSDVLSEQQYVQNASLGTGKVEFAVRMPDMHGQELLLPVDSKFPADTYLNLQNAYESGDKKQIQDARKEFCRRIRSEAQDISEKYLQPPVTTDYGILFLPTEGLYAEAVSAGLTEEVFRKYRIFITSPSTLVALLTTLQAGFQSIAIQKQSNDVWKLLEEIRAEFGNFAKVLANTQNKISSASDELEKLVGVRTRQMNKKLNNVQNYLIEQSSQDS